MHDVASEALGLESCLRLLKINSDVRNSGQYTPICIPPGGAPATCTQTYTSVAGDNCDSIGAKFGVSGDQILAWNTFLTCSDIWVSSLS